MPARSPKMKRRILGFQRRVWCPKWTPASSSSRMEIAGTVGPPMVVVAGLRRAAPTEPATPAPPSEASWARRVGVMDSGRCPQAAYQCGNSARPGAAGAPPRGRPAALEAPVAERAPVERANLAVEQQLGGSEP